jgi:hypothetical protein
MSGPRHAIQNRSDTFTDMRCSVKHRSSGFWERCSLVRKLRV